MARAYAIGLAALVLAAVPRNASAEDNGHSDETRECAAAYELTQRQQQRSELVGALESAERCARASCPALLRDECVVWATELRPKLPSLVVRVRGVDGCALRSARVEVDGATRKAPGGEALLVDPGVHEVVVTDSVSGRSKVQKIDFAPGERRDIDIDFASADAVCGGKRPQVSKGLKPALITGSIGGALVLAGATVGLIGASKRADLEECKPSCPRERIDEVRPFFLVGDVLAGFGVLALGAAVAMYFGADTTPTSRTGARFVLGASGVGASF